MKEAISVIAKTKTRDSNGDVILATGRSSPEEGLMINPAKILGLAPPSESSR